MNQLYFNKIKFKKLIWCIYSIPQGGTATYNQTNSSFSFCHHQNIDHVSPRATRMGTRTIRILFLYKDKQEREEKEIISPHVSLSYHGEKVFPKCPKKTLSKHYCPELGLRCHLVQILGKNSFPTLWRDYILPKYAAAIAEQKSGFLLREYVRNSIGDPHAGKDWRQEEKGTTEDEMVRWHHRLNGHEFA